MDTAARFYHKADSSGIAKFNGPHEGSPNWDLSTTTTPALRTLPSGLLTGARVYNASFNSEDYEARLSRLLYTTRARDWYLTWGDRYHPVIEFRTVINSGGGCQIGSGSWQYSYSDVPYTRAEFIKEAPCQMWVRFERPDQIWADWSYNVSGIWKSTAAKDTLNQVRVLGETRDNWSFGQITHADLLGDFCIKHGSNLRRCPDNMLP